MGKEDTHTQKKQTCVVICCWGDATEKKIYIP